MVNLPISYLDKQVTPFGGMSLIKRFLDQTAVVVWSLCKKPLTILLKVKKLVLYELIVVFILKKYSTI